MIPTDPPGVAAAQWAGMSGELAFDVGAHLGENFGPLRAAGARRIIAFEPEPDSFLRLLGAEDPDVEPVCAAAGAYVGNMELRYANGMFGNLTGDLRVTAVCVTLDHAAATYGVPDMVVVDVEGFEVQALAGAGELLMSGASWLVEFHTEALYHLVRGVLAGAGYDPVTIRHPHYAEGSDLWRGHGWIKALRP